MEGARLTGFLRPAGDIRLVQRRFASGGFLYNSTPGHAGGAVRADVAPQSSSRCR